MVTTANILIVDDKSDNLKFLFKILTQQGYLVRVIADSRQVLASVSTQQPDLILLDVMMPYLDGYQVCAQLKAHDLFSEIPVIFLSALNDIEDKIKAFEVGGVDYMTKPFQPQEILARVHTHVSLYQLRSELKTKNNQLEQEIIQRQQTETTLTERNRTLNTLLTNLPGMVYRCRNDQNWTMLFVSAGCFELTGYEPYELTDNHEMTYADLIHPEDQQRLWLEVQAALAVQQPFVVSYRIKDKKQQEKWMWEQGQGIFSPTGELLALEGFVMDITERKQTEKALRSSEQRFRSVVEHTPIGLCITDEHGYFEFVNTAYCRIYHYAPEALLGQHFTTVVPLEHRSQLISLHEQFITQGTELDGEWQVQTQTGQQLTVLAQAARISGSDGRPKKVTFVLDITDRKDAEQALQHSQQQLAAALAWQKAIFNNSSTGIVVVTGERIITEANERFLDIFGYQRAELLQQSTALFFPDEISYQQFGQKIYARTAEQEVYHLECQLKQKNGDLLWCDISGKAIDKTDLNQGVIWVVLDISERKRTEQALRDSEHRFKAIFNNAAVGIGVADAQGRYIEVNTQAMAMLGYSSSEIMQLNMTDVTHPDDLALSTHKFKQLLRGEINDYQIEKRYIRKNGEIFWAHLWAACWRDSNQQLKAVVGIVIDINERKRTEHQLQGNLYFLSTLINTIPIPVFYKDNQRRYLGCNQAFSDFVGKDALDIRGKTVQELWPSINANIYHQHDEHLLQKKHHQQYESQVLHADGSYRDVIFSKASFKQANGEIGGIIGTFIDITERKHSERILAQREAHLAALLKIQHYLLAVDSSQFSYEVILHQLGPVSQAQRVYVFIAADQGGFVCCGEWFEHTHWQQQLTAELFPGEWLQQLQQGQQVAHIASSEQTFLQQHHILAILLLPLRVESQFFGFIGFDNCLQAIPWPTWQISLLQATASALSQALEQQQAEQALKESQQRLATILNSIEIFIYVVDIHSHELLFINHYGRRLLDHVEHQPNWPGVQDDQNQYGDRCSGFWQHSDAQPEGILTWEEKNTITQRWFQHQDQIISWIDGRLVRLSIVTDITERKQAEDILRRSEEEMRRYFEQPLVGMATVNPKTRKFIQINDKFCEIMGYSREELLTMDWTHLTYHQDLEDNLQHMHTILNGEQDSFTLDKRYVRKEGALVYANVAVHSIRDSAGYIEAIVALVQDITDRKQMEMALRASEKRFRTLVNVIPHGVQEINPQGVITFSNHSSNRILGYEDQELVGKPVWDLVATTTEQQHLQDYFTYLFAERPPPTPYFSVNQRQDGQLIDVKIDWDYEYDQQGAIKGFVAVVTDITQQKQAEEALKLAQFSLDSAADGLHWVTPEGRFIYVNDAACQALGYSRIELLSLKVTDIDPSLSWEDWLHHWQQLKQQHSITLETYHQHQQGYLYPVEITANYLEFSHKEYLFASVRTITDRKKKEQQLQEAIKNAEHANAKFVEKNKELIANNHKLQQTLEQLQAMQQELIHSEKMAALGQLVAGVAHELNTPLGAIRSSIENITDFIDHTLIQLPEFFKSLSPQRQQDFLMLLRHKQYNNLSVREKRRLKRTLRQQLEEYAIEDGDNIVDMLVDLDIYEHIEPLLPLLRAPNGQMILKNVYELISIQKSSRTIFTAVDKASKVVFALRTFSRYNHSSTKTQAYIIDGIETALTLYHNQIKHNVEVIRNYAELPLIWCYPDELNQVWCNLIQNALQAMGYKGMLTINTYQHKQQVVVEVIDTGTGIPEAIQSKIFEPFFTTKAAGEGSGLGLDIVKKIIHKHEGKIELDRQEGQTCFRIYLPWSESL